MSIRRPGCAEESVLDVNFTSLSNRIKEVEGGHSGLGSGTITDQHLPLMCWLLQSAFQMQRRGRLLMTIDKDITYPLIFARNFDDESNDRKSKISMEN